MQSVGVLLGWLEAVQAVLRDAGALDVAGEGLLAAVDALQQMLLHQGEDAAVARLRPQAAQGLGQLAAVRMLGVRCRV